MRDAKDREQHRQAARSSEAIDLSKRLARLDKRERSLSGYNPDIRTAAQLSPCRSRADWKPGVLLAPGSFSGRHCNHQRHVLSDRLPRAPSPLAVLMCLHAGGNPMSASQRVSCGFHRLAVLSAAIPLLLGIIYSLWSSYQTANNELDRHHKLECAREHAALWPPVTTSSVGDDEETSSVGDDEEMGIPLSL